jgi:hypothetical protein
MEPVERRGPHLTRRDASHQTAWTGGIAKLIQIRGLLDAETLLKPGKAAAFGQDEKRYAHIIGR